MNSSYIQSDDWYVGVHVADDGTLLVYIDHAKGAVKCVDSELGEDDEQWAGHFIAENVRRPIRPTIQLRRKMTIEVNK